MIVEEPEDAPLTVDVIGGRLVIAIGVRMLAHAIQFAPSLEKHDEKTGDFARPKVTDALVFAGEVRDVLFQEEEDGTTPVHRMLDEAAEEAIEQGAEGIELP